VSSSNCKGCIENVNVNKLIIENVVKENLDKLAGIKNIQFTSDAVYEFRLKQCYSCKYLEYGTTCLQCGCLIEIRAKLLNGKCPYPKISKW
jgi:hypothetical protein